MLSQRGALEALADAAAGGGDERPTAERDLRAIRRFMLTPQPQKPRRYLPSSDGYADVPLCFTDGRGSHYTTRWRLCIN